MPDSRPQRLPSAYYWAAVSEFVAAEPDTILGRLAAPLAFDLNPDQRAAWQTEIAILKSALVDVQGTVYLEFDVPRLGSRIDAVLVSGPAVFPIEFKCGERRFKKADYNQAWDYALDLKNFHRASHGAAVLPVLVATEAPSSDDSWQPAHPDGVRPPRCTNADGLAEAINDGLVESDGPSVDGVEWGRSAYRPSPTIIEAARALYSRHTVDAISRNDAGAKNLGATSGAIEEIIEKTRADGAKAIIFVTGVPGAGKTLVGLNIATRRREFGDGRAVFLSGNGPLVAVLREALTRDEVRRVGPTVRKGEIRQQVKPFIQNVHHFRDEGLRNPDPPDDHVVIFDEAQRAWNREKTADFMKRRKKRPDFNESESAFLISCLDRHDDWAVVICLVGGGQEIHTGEAGIGAWLDAVDGRFRDWRVYVSPNLNTSDYDAGRRIQSLAAGGDLTTDDRLHLTTSMRSFRSESVSAFVAAVLDCDMDASASLLERVRTRYPIALTRDLGRAKAWVRRHARGSERCGLMASSQAQRLKPHAVDIRVAINPVHWFLNDGDDTRSSDYLEDAATEFQVQGLEVDWACVMWDADLRRHDRAWSHHAFRGARWTNVKHPDRQRYLLNAYRVLLTRARQGMVIFVPPGDLTDATRRPAFYDDTFNYLASLGLSQI